MHSAHERAFGVLLLAFGAAGLGGCEVGLPAGESPFAEFNWTDMRDQPKLKPQRGDLFGTRPTGDLAPTPGTVATDEHPYRFRQDQVDLAAKAGVNPLPHSPEVIAAGRKVFDSVCIVCHGAWAQGDGNVARLFPKPPSLTRAKVREYTDARIFHVPMRGQGSMPSYAKQLEPNELWAVVHYLRDLQDRLPVAGDDVRDLVQTAPAPAVVEPAGAAGGTP